MNVRGDCLISDDYLSSCSSQLYQLLFCLNAYFSNEGVEQALGMIRSEKGILDYKVYIIYVLGLWYGLNGYSPWF